MQQALILKFGAPANENTIPVPHGRIFDAATEMIEDLSFQGQWRLQGLTEGLHRLDRERDGFGAEDIATVVQAWEGFDGGAWDGGFVFDLHDGRRVRMACMAAGYDWEREGKIFVSFVPGDYDEQEKSKHWLGDAHVYETELPELQEYLRRLTTH